MIRFSVFVEIRLVQHSDAELIATGSGVFMLKPGAFGQTIVVVKDGREHLLPTETAAALFGESALLAVLTCAEVDG